MANWKKVLVSGSNIEVAHISASALNLSSLAAAGNPVLTVDATGKVSTTAQGSLEGADQNFFIRGAKDTAAQRISFSANNDELLFTTQSNHGFTFDVTDNTPGTGTSSIFLVTPQDLQTSATPNFAGLDIGVDGVGGTIGAGTSNNDNSITLNDGTNTIGFTVGGYASTFTLNTTNIDTPTEFRTVNFNSAQTKNFNFRIAQLASSGNTVKGLLQNGVQGSHLFFVSGGQVGIGADSAILRNNANNKLFISGGDLAVSHAITASALPSPSRSISEDDLTLVAYDSVTGGFKSVSTSSLAVSIASSVSGAFTAASSSIATDIDNIQTDISNLSIPNVTGLISSASRGIRFQDSEGTTDQGSTISLIETASFVGTANEVGVSHSVVSDTESKFTIGLPDDVTIPSDLTVTDTISVGGGATFTTITASGDISGSSTSNLTVGGDITLGGTLSFSGLSLIQNQAAVLSGSTIFGSGSNGNEAGINTHQFTGSLSISGSSGLSVNAGDLTVNDNITVNNGNLTVSAGDIFVTDGGINAQSITGSLAISSSGHLFASLSLESKDQVVLYDTADGKFYRTSSNSIQGQNVIGPAEDGDYTDGLFDTFTDSTPTGTAIDLINEVLAGLAPSAAPDLDDIDFTSVSYPGAASGQSSPQSARLSYGTSGTTVMSGTSSVDTSTATGNNLSNVNVNGAYTVNTTSTDPNDLRIGVISSSNGFTTITGQLNGDVTADEAAFVNFGNDAFGKGDQGVLHINVNGTLVHSQSLSGSFGGAGVGGTVFQEGVTVGTSFNPNNSGFVNLSTTMSAAFPSSGNTLDIFKHRSGSWQVGAGDQREGYNFVRIEHKFNDASQNKVTNYCEWVNDSDGSVIESTPQTISFTGAGLKTLSGIHYFTTFSGEYKVKIDNAYKNVYGISGDNDIQITHTVNNTVNTFKVITTGSKITVADSNTDLPGTLSSNLSETVSRDYPTLNTSLGAVSSSTLEITASYKSDPTDRAIAMDTGTNFIQMNTLVLHPVKNTHLSDSKTLAGVLSDNRTNNSTAQVENFVSESFRLPSASYDQQSDIDFSSPMYISERSLLSSTGDYDKNLQIVVGNTGQSLPGTNTNNGSLIYPDTNYSSITRAPITNPNYDIDGVSAIRHYYRAFKNESGSDKDNFSFTITGANSNVLTNFGTNSGAATAGTLSSTNYFVGLTYPGNTNTLDLALPKPNTNLQNFGDGCNVSSIDQSGTTITNTISFLGTGGGSFVGNNEFIVIIITYNNTFSGYINKIDFSTFA
jgi:hypothetical protein